MEIYSASSAKLGIKIRFTINTFEDSIHPGDIIMFKYENENRYFKVMHVVAGKNIYTAEAVNIGYYHKLKKVDLRELTGLYVNLVTDEETKIRLNKESNYI